MNTGKTPALDFKAALGTRAHRKGDKFEAVYPTGDPTEESISALHPGVRLEIKNTFPAKNFSEAEIDAVKRGDMILYFYIEIMYRDIFKQPHLTRACAYMNQDLLAATVCDTYNDAN